VRRCNAEAVDSRFRVNETKFMALIEAVRARGWAETAGDVTPGLGAIAITFNSPMGNAPLAVGCGGPTDQLLTRRDEVLAALSRFEGAFTAPD
jgi:DNA-binding IclR family transcriptional regulator